MKQLATKLKITVSKDYVSGVERDNIFIVKVDSVEVEEGIPDATPYRHYNFTITIGIVGQDDAGNERLLNIEPDGARKFAQKVLNGGEAVDSGLIQIDNREVNYYDIIVPNGAFDRYNYGATVLRIKHKTDNITIMTMYPAAHREERKKIIFEMLETISLN